MPSTAPSNSRWLVPAMAVSYAVLAGAAIWLTRLNHGIAMMWVANGPLLAALCVTRRERWPALVLAAVSGAIAASILLSPLGWRGSALSVPCVAEAVVAAALLRRWRLGRDPFRSMRSLAGFVGLAGLLAPAMSAVPAVAAAAVLFGSAPGSTAVAWIIGHALGNLIATPLAVVVIGARRELRDLRDPRCAWRAAALMLAVVGTTAAVFGQTTLPVLFVPVLPVLAATFVLGRPGAAISIVLVALVGGGLTLHGNGPVMLIHGGDVMRLQFFNLYLASLFLLALPVAAALAERDALVAALGESEARYRLIADHATDIMLTLDPDGSIRFASPSVRELGFFEPSSLIGRNAVTLVHPDDRARVQAVHLQALAAADRTFSVEYRAVRADMSIAWFETNTRAVRGADGRVGAVVSIIRDLDGRKRREDELVRAASTDPLTGLLNRAAFRSRVVELMRDQRGATLAVLDLDHFKQVNDRHGHATGDAALLMMADLLRENLRPTDAIARVGGEEFAVLLAGSPVEAAAQVCERLRLALAARALPDVDTAPTHVTVSIGLAPIAGAGELDAVFQAADVALYAAKGKGRNRVEIAA